MTLEQLIQVIAAAKDEGERRIAEIQEVIWQVFRAASLNADQGCP